MLEMVHYILRFITTMKRVIYVAILSAAIGGLGSAVNSPSGVWGGARAEIKFNAF